jgi:hypothetical protein
LENAVERGKNKIDLKALYSLADEHSASQLIAPMKDGRLLIGILKQYRYWTPTRARLCALTILHEHLEHLTGK